MNTGTFDFSAMSTDELFRVLRALAFELYNRCEPARAIIVKTLKTVKSWFF